MTDMQWLFAGLCVGGVVGAVVVVLFSSLFVSGYVSDASDDGDAALEDALTVDDEGEEMQWQ